MTPDCAYDDVNDESSIFDGGLRFSLRQVWQTAHLSGSRIGEPSDVKSDLPPSSMSSANRLVDAQQYCVTISHRNIPTTALREIEIKSNENAFAVRDDQFLHQFVLRYCVTTRHLDTCEEGAGINPDVQAPTDHHRPSPNESVEPDIGLAVAAVFLILCFYSAIFRPGNESQIRYSVTSPSKVIARLKESPDIAAAPGSAHLSVASTAETEQG
jgi:hypothetical protein